MNGTLAGDDTDHDQGPSLTRLFDFSAVIVMLWSCRRLIMRTTLLMRVFLFLHPSAIVSVLNSIFLWTAIAGTYLTDAPRLREVRGALDRFDHFPTLRRPSLP